MVLLEVVGISRHDEAEDILKEVSFKQRRFQKIAIVGEAGSGKSTLLKIIAGLIQPDGGEVLFEGNPVEGPTEKLVPGHKFIAYLSQHFELAHSLRVEQVLEYANVLTEEEAAALYEVCKISHLLKRKTNQLSGGEAQRIAIARLLIGKPKLLLLDEPFSNLDMVNKSMLKTVIDAIGKKLSVSCIMVSHDPVDTLPWADKIVVMKNGQVVQKGSPIKIYRKPIDEYTAGLFGEFALISSKLSAAFAKVNSKAIRKNTVLRPENFKIATKESKGVKGVVTAVNFYGSHYLVEVLILGYGITVRTVEQNILPGNTVYLSLNL